MIKKITAISLLFTFLTSFSSPYVFSESDFEKDFQQLDKVEEEYFEHEKAGTVEMYKQQFLESPVVSADPFAMGTSNEEFYFDIESFAWGLCCCPVGLFVVAVNNNKDQDQKKSYWIGVLANVVLGTGGCGLSLLSAGI